jgi:tetratricopeptide (TPR) repeat protein
LAEAEAAFRAAAGGADDLGKQIAAINEAMGKGNLDEAQAMADGVVDSYRDIYERAKDYLDQLKSEWQTYYDRVAEIQDKITGLNRSADEAIREIRRKAMSEEELWADKRLEYEEQYSAGVQAMRAKDYEAAEEYFSKAMRLAEGFGDQNSALAIELIEKTRKAAG